MTRGVALRWIARRIPHIDATLRSDLLLSVDEIAARTGTGNRLLEFVSLLGFGLTSWSRGGTDDNRRHAVRQGWRLAGLVLACFLTAEAWTADQPAVAIAASAVAVTLAAGLRRLPLPPAAVVVVTAFSSGDRHAVTLALAVLVTVVAGQRFDRHRCVPGGLVTLAAVTLGGWVASTDPESIRWMIDPAGVVVTVAFLVIGWFEPRFAVAAAAIAVINLAASDPGVVSGALRALTTGVASLDMARMAVMMAAVMAAWVVSQQALQRLHQD